MTDDLYWPVTAEVRIPGQGGRSSGRDFMALVAVVIVTVSLSLSGLFIGAHLALATERIPPSLPQPATRRFIDPAGVFLGWGGWLASILLCALLPHRSWRGILFALVFAPLGTLLRFRLALWLNGARPSFPLGTFTANMVGTAVLGMAWDLEHVPIGGVVGCQVLMGVGDGFCGCLTTVSTWVAELSGLGQSRPASHTLGASLAIIIVIPVIMIIEYTDRTPAPASVPSIMITPPITDLTKPLRAMPRPICAAETEHKGELCGAEPRLICPYCYIFAYCSSSCRRRHWKESHHKECQKAIDMALPDGWTVDNPVALGDWLSSQKTYWHNYPATDVLRLDKTEGAWFESSLNMLFYGAAGIRHLIYSVANMVDTARPQLNVVVDEHHFSHYLRSFLALHLLAANGFDPVDNAEAVIHMWYSSLLPRRIHDHIRAVVRANTDGFFDSKKELKKGKLSLLTWGTGHQLFEAAMTQRDFDVICDFFDDTSTQIRLDEACRFVDRNKDIEPVEGLLARMDRSRCLSLLKWREDGLFLPYTYSRHEFDMLNPIIYSKNWPFQKGVSSEPLTEWPMEILDFDCGPATEDMYGKAYFYLHDLFVRFQGRLADMSVRIRVAGRAIVDIDPRLYFLPWGDLHDRIEVGETWDTAPLTATVFASRFLRPTQHNPFATALMMTKESLNRPCVVTETEAAQENAKLLKKTGLALDQLAPPVKNVTDDPKMTARRALALVLWRDWDKFSDAFLESPTHFGFNSISFSTSESKSAILVDESIIRLKPKLKSKPNPNPRSIVEEGFLGLHMQRQNTITQRFPNRVVHKAADVPCVDEFERWMSWASVKPQRWLEWKRVGDEADCDFDEWMLWVSLTVKHLADEIELILAQSLLEDPIDRVWMSKVGSTGETTLWGPRETGTSEKLEGRFWDEVRAGVARGDIKWVPIVRVDCDYGDGGLDQIKKDEKGKGKAGEEESSGGSDGDLEEGEMVEVDEQGELSFASQLGKGKAKEVDIGKPLEIKKSVETSNPFEDPPPGYTEMNEQTRALEPESSRPAEEDTVQTSKPKKKKKNKKKKKKKSKGKGQASGQPADEHSDFTSANTDDSDAMDADTETLSGDELVRFLMQKLEKGMADTEERIMEAEKGNRLSLHMVGQIKALRTKDRNADDWGLKAMEAEMTRMRDVANRQLVASRQKMQRIGDSLKRLCGVDGGAL
ncbi:hypothetical protein CDD80_199 [Ophiocordyceps camponoti-rufipedis]|uniref:MYND-type domain-containing protein n=1 Tax=Ophiocordyceps camponoti-rufipedis TaxID=2004952 RepID=A0A2C5YKE3_9HYPO|nr:hypothetical protein CDD80_199 [Ophiocordyceps camponoti-rufipedis]